MDPTLGVAVCATEDVVVDFDVVLDVELVVGFELTLAVVGFTDAFADDLAVGEALEELLEATAAFVVMAALLLELLAAAVVSVVFSLYMLSLVVNQHLKHSRIETFH